MNERLSKLKTWLLSCSYPLAIIEKAFFNAKLQGPAPKKEEIIIPFVSTHYSNFDSKSISITSNSLLSNVKDNKLKVFDKRKVIHVLKQSKQLFLKSMVCIAINAKILSVIYEHRIYKNVHVS